MFRIQAEFTSCEDTLVPLDTPAARRDLEPIASKLAAGLRVTLYMAGEFEVEAILERGPVWLGVPDWSTVVYY